MLGSQLTTLSSSADYSTYYDARYRAGYTGSGSVVSEQPANPHIPSSVVQPEEQRDRVILNPESVARSSAYGGAPSEASSSEGAKIGPDGQEYTEEEREEIEELEERDREVRRHEQAHFQSAGKYANPPKYEFQTGPDGKRYAVGGSVEIDMSEVSGDPQATLEKARAIKRAALAPEDPSAQDRKVARQADKMAAEAQRAIIEERMDTTATLAGGQAPLRAPALFGASGNPDAASPASSTETLEASLGERRSTGISQYRTSRLEFSGTSVYHVERLASPSRAQLLSPSVSHFDLYV